MKRCLVHRWGQIPYQAAWEWQKEYVAKRQKGLGEDVLVLLEHPPVFTIGKNGKAEHLLIDPAFCARLGVEVVHVDRGGDITYHGPGQIVGYPILDLHHYRRDIKWYVSQLEEVMIRAVAAFGVEARRLGGLRGVWVGDRKIGAIGARVSKWITSHGFALNINTALDYFKLIVPCGIAGKGVTSVAELVGHSVDMDDAKNRTAEAFGKVFGCEVVYEEEDADVVA